MLGSAPLEAVLGAGIDNRDHEAVRATIRAMADLGLSVLFIYPDSKMPADLRTPRQKSADDKVAQTAAQAGGRRDWATVKSPAGLALATSDKTVLDRYLKRYIQMFSTWAYVADHDRAGETVPWTKKAEDASEIAIREPAAVNLAVEVGGSGVVVVDCDTAAQMQRWFEAAGVDLDQPAPPPTVLTPGQAGADADMNDPATWAHADGGHFWFTVPDKYLPVLPRHIGAMTWGGDDGFAVLWDRRYVLVPPSTRPEGRYEQLGHVYDLPPWLAEAIVKAGERRIQRAQLADGARTENTGLADKVDAWAMGVDWADILEPLGWTPAPRADACGCAVWTAPGNHASPKSATAHDTGCTSGRYSEVNAPLYVWTDHDAEPFDTWLTEHETRTISKLQAVAVISYDGNIGKAMDGLGVTPDLAVEPGLDLKGPDADLNTASDGDFQMPVTEDDAGEPQLFCFKCATAEGEFQVAGVEIWHRLNDDDPDGHRADLNARETTEDAAEVTAPTFAADLSDLPADFGMPASTSDASPYPDDVDDPDPDVFDSQHPGVPRIAPFSHWRDLPPPEYIIEGLIEHGGLSCIIGSPGIGKSTFALDIACHIATGKRWQGRVTLKTRVLYLPGEGLSGVVDRLRAWEAAHMTPGMDLGNDLLLGNGIIQVAAQNEAWGEIAAYIARQEIGLVIFDTFARMSSGLEENSATDVGRAVRRFGKLKELTNVGVCVVHHTGKGDPNTGRGSSALNGALDSELLVRPGTWDTDQLRDDNGRMEGKAIEILTSKQKNAEQIEHPIPLLMIGYPLPDTTPPRTAALITGPNGDIDPMQGEVIFARPGPEPIVETSIRIREFVDGLPQQGASKAEIALAVRPDAYARSRADTPAYWKQRIIEATDRGLRYQLIETLTGTPSGARYIPSANTPDQARVLAAAEVTNSD